MGPPQSDARLARRAAAGDERAFAAIFRRYHQELYRFCLSILGRPEDAQEALQNTMVKALRSLPGEERELRLKPWLYRVAHNESIDLLRKRREGPELERVEASAGAEVAETVELRARLSRLLADLGELPARQRSALVMRELAGLGYEQIGEAFETTAAVARQTVYEARLGLRELEAGREMSCEEVTRLLSDDDGRVLRRRDVQAHLRSCADCRAFRDAIPRRREDLAAIAPLPAVAAAAILHGIGGGQAVGGAAATSAAVGAGTPGAGAAAAGKVAALSLALKGAAAVAVVAAVGVTAADRTGLVHLDLGGGSGAAPAAHATRAPGAGGQGSGGTSRGPGHRSANPAGTPGGGRPSEARPNGGAESTGGGTAGYPQTSGPPTPARHAAPASTGELPAAAGHGQETAAGHGGGRANAGSRAGSHAPSGGSEHPSPPPHPASPGAEPEHPSSSPGPPSGVGADNPGGPPLQPSEGPPAGGAPASQGARAPKEER